MAQVLGIDLDLSQDSQKILCKRHKKERCDDCNIDWTKHNAHVEAISKFKNANAHANVGKVLIALKEQGNTHYKNSEFHKAIEVYTKAIDIALSPLPLPEIREEKDKPTLFVRLFSNRSLAYLENKQHAEALMDAVVCTQMEPSFAKGWFRKGKALEALYRYKEALSAYQAGLCHDPKNEELQGARRKLNDRL